jgi:hypothetical protein
MLMSAVSQSIAISPEGTAIPISVCLAFDARIASRALYTQTSRFADGNHMESSILSKIRLINSEIVVSTGDDYLI